MKHAASAPADNAAGAGVGVGPASGDTVPQPPVHAVRVDVGIGKSTEARRQSAKRLQAMRRRGDRRVIIFAVPTAKLGHEQAAMFMAMPEAQGLVARVRLGRERPDPEELGQTMCRDLEAVTDAQMAMMTVQSAVCRKTDRNGSNLKKCLFFDVCGYQRQRKQKANLWFVAHEQLFLSKPTEIGQPAIVVVDEAPWDAGLIGHDGSHIDLSCEALGKDYDIADAPFDSLRLFYLRRRLIDALDHHPFEPLSRKSLVAVGLTPESAKEAIILEWRRKVEVDMWPGMPAAQRREAARQGSVNRSIKRLVILWKAVAETTRPDGPEASGWAALTMADTKEGPLRVVRLKGRSDVNAAWQVPTLLLDATMRLELVRPFWPQARLTADIQVAMPHQHIYQVVDGSFAKGRLKAEAAMRWVHAVICRETRRFAPQPVLAVLQADAESALRELAFLPKNLATAHHNAVAGRDEWKDVAAQIVVGRTAPSPAAVERQAEALAGEAVAPIDGWYPKSPVRREMVDGRSLPANADRHPHPIAEALRWCCVEGELIQILGRARGANRTSGTAVTVLLMCDVVLPVPVERAIAADDLRPSPWDRMLALSGVAVLSAADAADAFPSLWPTREAAKKAMERFEDPILGTFLYREVPIKECPQDRLLDRLSLLRVEYLRAGQGRRPTCAYVDTDLVDDPEGWLVSRLGPLAWTRRCR